MPALCLARSVRRQTDGQPAHQLPAGVRLVPGQVVQPDEHAPGRVSFRRDVADAVGADKFHQLVADEQTNDQHAVTGVGCPSRSSE